MKYYPVILILFFAVGCSSNDIDSSTEESGTTTEQGATNGEITSNGTSDSGEIETCGGDKPTNIDGYFDSIYSPLSMAILSDKNENFDVLQYAEVIENYVDFRIGVGSAYNLGSSGVISEHVHFESMSSRSTCDSPGRYSVGPVITSISIVANQPIGENYPSGSELNSIFSIALLQRAVDVNYPPTQASVPRIIPKSVEYFSVENFLVTEPLAPLVFLLRLNKQPTAPNQHIFTITYTLSSGLSGSVQATQVLFKQLRSSTH